MEREVVCEGHFHRVLYAVRKDGSTAPAREVLDYLQSGTWAAGCRAHLHADEQVETYAALMYTMQYFAEYGEGDRYESMNGLEDGIFEFKARRARIAFFDTCGDGTTDHKAKIRDRDESPYPESPTWHMPDFDEQVRLCNGWPKRSQTTVPSDISFARQVREEDLRHDRQ